VSNTSITGVIPRKKPSCELQLGSVILGRGVGGSRTRDGGFAIIILTVFYANSPGFSTSQFV
jgi:hypothetical protein